MKLNFWCVSGEMAWPDSWVTDGWRAILGHCKDLGGPLKPLQVESFCDHHWLKKQYRYTSKTFLSFIKLFIRPVTNEILQFPNTLHPWIVAFRTSLIGSQSLLASIVGFETLTTQLGSGFSDHIQAVSAFTLGVLHTDTSTKSKSPIPKKFPGSDTRISFA